MSGMTINLKIPFKAKLVQAMLFIAIVIDAFSLFVFLRIDSIVHKDLYNYGLQYSDEWAYQYWAWSSWYLRSIAIAIMFTGISIALFLFYIHAKKDTLRLLYYATLIIAIISSPLSAFALKNIDGIVHSDLYLYGLKFSYKWATAYWMNLAVALSFTVSSTAINLFNLALVYLGSRKLVRIELAKLTSITLISIGAASLILSTIYTSSILAFIGLGLTFWGIILAYIRTEEYVKEELLSAAALPPLETINQLLEELDYKDKAVYLPPKYMADPEASKVYIPKQEDGKLPTPEQTQKHGNKLFIDNPKGLFLTPPGAALVKTFENTLQTSFTRVDLQYVQEKMPKLLIEDLEIAQNFDMEIKENRVCIKMKNSAYKNVTKKAKELSKVYSILGCPIISAIACALAKASGKLVIIENQQISEDGENMEVQYCLKEGE